MNAQNPLIGAVNRAARELDNIGREDLAKQLRDAALPFSTPPADDVREALAECVHTGLRRDDWGVANEYEREEPLAVSDAILAAFEVRPHGTITDADAKEEAVALAYNEVTGADGDEWSPDRTLAALNALWDAAKGGRS